MKKLKLFGSLLLILAFVLSACSTAETPTTAPVEEPTTAPAEEPAEEPSTGPENPNEADFTYVGDPDEVFDLNTWYGDVGVEADVTIKSPGAVKVPDIMTTDMPKADEEYTIGFSVYYTVDEVGSMILESMKEAAEEAGVELLVARAKKQLWDAFTRTGLMDILGRDHMFALRTQAFKYAWDKLGDNHAETCPLRVAKPVEADD